VRALLLAAEGGVRLAEVADAPLPGRGEVRIAMHLTPVNPADRLAIGGHHLTAEYAAIPLGSEGVGRIVEIGAGIDDLKLGDRVVPLDRGTWAEQRTVPAARVLRVPDGLSDAQAALFRITPPTAHRLLARAGLNPGDWVILNAAGSMVGRLVTVMAQTLGLQVIGVVRSPEKDRDRLLALGAAEVIGQGDAMVAEALAIMGGARAHLAIDFIAGTETGRLARCLGPGGRVTVAGHLGMQPCSIPSTLLTSSSILVDGFSLRRDEGGLGRAALQPAYDPLAAVCRDHPQILVPLRPYTISDHAAAIAYRGPERPLLDWTAP